MLPRLVRRRTAPPPTGGSASRTEILANIEQTTSISVRGWALDPTSPDPVIIELRTAAGEVLKRAVANLPRPDVGRQHGTGGFHGFWMRLPLRRHGLGSIEVLARSRTGEIRLDVIELDELTALDVPTRIEFYDTMIAVRTDGLAEVLGNETLVICGPGRGGTSVVAYVLRRAGYYLGEELGSENHEDLDILAAIRNRSQMKTIIAGRNQQHKRWGFKIPLAVNHIHWLVDVLRNPIFLVAFRNPVAIAKSLVRRDERYADTTLYKLGSAFEHGLHKMELGAAQVLIAEAPSILIDVDAARGNASRLVRDLTSVFVPDVSEELARAIASDIGAPGYKTVR
jgi:hypothetical protein